MEFDLDYLATAVVVHTEDDYTVTQSILEKNEEWQGRDIRVTAILETRGGCLALLTNDI